MNSLHGDAPSRPRFALMSFVRAGMVCGCLAIAACGGQPEPPGTPAPEWMRGRFIDDYGIEYVIGVGEWRHVSSGRYRVVSWHVDQQFLIVQNDPGNETAPGLWTRIDWVELEGDSAYRWGYCYAIYDAPSEQAAMAAPPSDRANPREGCNGFPFSRMRRSTTGTAD